MQVIACIVNAIAVALSITPPDAAIDNAALHVDPGIAVAPPGCVADVNGDDDLNILDYITFNALFSEDDPAADINDDGVLNILDFVALHDAFVAGCDQAFVWTDFQPSPDTRFVHVSSATGDDANDGATPDAPVRTLARACELVRDGYPDWLLLKRGDSWTGEDFGRWKKSGRSKSEPMYIGAYGASDKRPLVQTGKATRAFWLDGAAGLNHVAIDGIEFHAHTYDGVEGAEAGILWLGGGGDLIIEDCLVRGYKDNIVFHGFGQTAKDLRVRGCVIVDAWSKVAHAQGLYAQEAQHIVVEGCVFDHNGWVEGVPGAEANPFNHNIYIQYNANFVDVRDCLLVDASSHAIQMRCSGNVEDCVFISNPIGLLVGNGGEAPPAVTRIAGNAFLFADDINPDTPRGMGIDLQNIASGEIVANLIADEKSVHAHGHAMKMHASAGAPVYDVLFDANIIHEWRGGIRFNESSIDGVTIADNIIHNQFTDTPIIKHQGNPLDIGITYDKNRYYSGAPDYTWYQVVFDVYDFEGWTDLVDELGAAAGPTTFIDPGRTVETFQASMGQTPTHAAFIEAVRAQGRLTWDPRYSTRAILAYFQEGYTPLP
jgi:hypothetical protein